MIHGRSCSLCGLIICYFCCFFFSSRRRHTRSLRDWSSDVCSSDLGSGIVLEFHRQALARWRQRELRSEERRVGKGVDLGGRRIIKKKKTKNIKNQKHVMLNNHRVIEDKRHTHSE